MLPDPGLVARLAALDRLNNWASCAYPEEPPRRMIYWMKGQALTELVQHNLVANRLVHVDVRCHGCGGTGRYVHPSGDEARDCWRCNSSGTAHLVFVESTIPTDPPIRWHSPTDGYGAEFGRGVYHREWLLAGGKTPPTVPAEQGWTVKQPGTPIEVGEAAHLLCLCEDRWPRPKVLAEDLASEREHGYADDLYLGRTEGPCVLCGADSSSGAQVRSPARRLSWVASICDGHNRDRGLFAKLRDAGPPAHFLDDMRIRRWMERHPPIPGMNYGDGRA